MPEEFDPAWEYFDPDPEIAELLADESDHRPTIIDVLDCSAFVGGLVRNSGNASVKPDALCRVCGAPFVSKKYGGRRGRSEHCSGVCAWKTRLLRSSRPPGKSWLRPCLSAKPDRRTGDPRLILYRCPECRSVGVSPHPNKTYCSYDCKRHFRRRGPTPTEELIVTLDEAQTLIRLGALFGDVYSHVPLADRDVLKEWFVREPGLPNRDARNAVFTPEPDPTKKMIAVRASGFTGDICPRCQGCHMIRSGACLRCEDCGESSSC